MTRRIDAVDQGNKFYPWILHECGEPVLVSLFAIHFMTRIFNGEYRACSRDTASSDREASNISGRFPLLPGHVPLAES